jgi:hypothetical protein
VKEGQFAIPNEEMRIYWKQETLELLKAVINVEINKALITFCKDPIDLGEFHERLGDIVIKSVPYHDFIAERDLHNFLNECFATLPGYVAIPSSNLESGCGNIVCLRLTDRNRVIANL